MNRHLIAGMTCLLTATLARHWLEAAMLRHMLLQLPLLLCAGWLMAVALAPYRPRWLRGADVIDQHGICGLTALFFISAYWMIPRALEQSMNAAPAEAAKFASLLAMGAILPGSLRRANWVVQLFYLGNISAMMALAGIQYQNMPQRLCNAYLLDDQADTGVGLVIAAVVVALLWCRQLSPAFRSSLTKAPHHAAPTAEPDLHRHAGP